MRKGLLRLKGKHLYDQNMIDDLDFILAKIPEDYFVAATLNLQPFKPMFSARSPRQLRRAQSRKSVDSEEEEEVETHFTVRTRPEESPPRFKNSIVQLKHTVCEKLDCE